MAADDLSFPSPESLDDPHASEIAAQLRASYAAQPAHDAAHLARVTRAILSQQAAGAADGATGGTTGGAAAPVAPPRPFVVSPRWWVAAAAALFIAVLARPWRPQPADARNDGAMAAVDGAAFPAPSGRTSEERGGTVRFEFTFPGRAHDVALVGDFNGWDTGATPMQRVGAGATWSARVPLEPGRHEYAFVVDGRRWVVDPLAPQVPDAGFGPTNAVIVDAEALQ